MSILVVAGADAEGRRRLATEQARLRQAHHIPSRAIRSTERPLSDMREEITRATGEGADGLVLEIPMELPVAAVEASLARIDEVRGTVSARLDGIWVAVHAPTLFLELQDDTTAHGSGDPRALRVPSRALLVAQQLERATMVVVDGIERCGAASRAQVLALIGFLQPTAGIVIARPGGVLRVRSASAPGEPSGLQRMLDADGPSVRSAAGVTLVRYDAGRPFHPGRLHAVLGGPIDRHEHGWMLRSVGTCTMAGAPALILRWNQAGGTVGLHIVQRPLGHPAALATSLALIGIRLDVPAVRAALDGALLTDAEFAAGPAVWRGSPDPFLLRHRRA